VRFAEVGKEGLEAKGMNFGGRVSFFDLELLAESAERDEIRERGTRAIPGVIRSIWRFKWEGTEYCSQAFE
jgi:hypothetical protein